MAFLFKMKVFKSNTIAALLQKDGLGAKDYGSLLLLGILASTYTIAHR